MEQFRQYFNAAGTNSEKFELWLEFVGLEVKNHQIFANQWCHGCETTGNIRGGILADEMGLGKTIVMLGRLITHCVDRTLIIVPPALLKQWEMAIETYLGVAALVYHGGKGISDEELADNALVLTTYGIVHSRKQLTAISWNRIICDEAHHLRNMRTWKYLCVKKLKSEIMWLLTGTPIQNRKRDFYALCSILGYSPDFYGTKAGEEEIISTRFLQRTKAEVGLRLPPIHHHKIIVSWKKGNEESLATTIHKKLSYNIPVGGAMIAQWIAIQHMLVAFIRARQMCIHPLLIQNAKNGPSSEIWEDMTTSKLDAVVRIIRRRKDNARRKLVFCYYRGELDELQKRLSQNGITAGIIDGRTKKNVRKNLLHSLITRKLWNELLPTLHDGLPIYDKVSEFLKPEVLLVQIQTACEGLNLQDFHEVYFTSTHWNPAVEEQAIARCHRIGQQQHIDVFRFMMGDIGNDKSLDAYCDFVQERKRAIVEETFG